MYILYDILLHLSLLLLIPYFLFKMLFVGKYRKGILERFGFIGKEKIKNISHAKVAWLHAVSVGETKAAMPLLKGLKKKYPNLKIVFSCVTPTGNAVAAQEGLAWIDSLIYSPLDFDWVVKRVVKMLRPNVFIVMEKEIWPNVLKILTRNDVPVMVVNGSISDRSFRRYTMFGFFFRRIFKNVSYFLCQTKKDSDKAIALGIESSQVMVIGNIKFDIEPPQWNPLERDVLLQRLSITAHDRTFVAGSTHEGEEEIVLGIFERLKPEFSNLKLILAPRHPERFDIVEKLIRERGFSIIKRSQESEVRSQEKDIKSEVILVDSMGELCNFYSIATVAFVGGTLVDIGGHNLLEPAFYKKPVIYGHYLQSYAEMADMLETAGGGIRIDNGEEFLDKVRRLLSDEAYRQRVGNAAYSVVEANKGATEKCLKVLEGLLLE
jgi:3-deoxy-D-manno-octulosonic-acid transferase